MSAAAAQSRDRPQTIKPASPRRPAGHASEDGRPVRIVIIDDDHAVLRALSFFLGLEGFEVTVFDSGPAFLAAGEPPPPCCAIIDQDMARMTGLALAQSLRARGWALPLVMISGTVTPLLETRALAAGFVAVLEKPLYGDELGEVIAQAVSGR